MRDDDPAGCLLDWRCLADCKRLRVLRVDRAAIGSDALAVLARSLPASRQVGGRVLPCPIERRSIVNVHTLCRTTVVRFCLLRTRAWREPRCRLCLREDRAGWALHGMKALSSTRPGEERFLGIKASSIPTLFTARSPRSHLHTGGSTLHTSFLA